mgnify:FL=1
MRVATHIYTGPSACGCFVDGERHTVTPGQRVPFGRDDIDKRASDRLGEFFVPLDGYVDDSAPAPSSDDGFDGPEWARLSVAGLCELADGFSAFSKQGLEALCVLGDLDCDGSVSDLRARLFDDMEAAAPEFEEEEDAEEFGSFDDIDKMDPEFGMREESD